MTKIIIPVSSKENNGKHPRIQGFHNSEYTCIYDTTNKTYEWSTVNNIMKSGIGLELTLKYRGINVIITNSILPLAYSFFVDNGFEVVKAQGNNLLENIELYIKKSLNPFTVYSPGNGSSCSNSCEFCHTSCN
ncbi:MAG: hypothetical protein ACOCVN_01550 [bacterium]